ncbi:MAG: hypothetical protein IPL12_16695 [Bacteroidetes bacterium]|nr:hypothetical protein [Bacteroidota bacterium]MBK8344776.1 hypothetical protein [Bacteroidota bacterium]
MQRSVFVSLVVLVLIGAASLQACKHTPLDFIPEDPILIVDTTGGGPDTLLTSNCDPDTVYFENDVFPILLSNCAMSGCHDNVTHEEGINLTTYAKVISSHIMDAGDPFDSEFYDVITESGDDKMPPWPNPPLTAEEIDLVMTWMEQGALNNSCTDCDTTAVTFSGTILPIMQAYCTGCHSTGSPDGSISLTAYNGAGSNDGIADVAADGRLLGAIQHEVGFVSMPPGGSTLPDCLIDQIRIWVEAGYPED